MFLNFSYMLKVVLLHLIDFHKEHQPPHRKLSESTDDCELKHVHGRTVTWTV